MAKVGKLLRKKPAYKECPFQAVWTFSDYLKWFPSYPKPPSQYMKIVCLLWLPHLKYFFNQRTLQVSLKEWVKRTVWFLTFLLITKSHIFFVQQSLSPWCTSFLGESQAADTWTMTHGLWLSGLKALGDKIDPENWRAKHKIAFGSPPVLVMDAFIKRPGPYISPKDRKNHLYPAELSYFKWFCKLNEGRGNGNHEHITTAWVALQPAHSCQSDKSG